MVLKQQRGFPKKMEENNNCSTSPSIPHKEKSKKHWQNFEASKNSTFYIYNAFYDGRHSASTPVVRILVLADRRVDEKRTYYCQLWLKDNPYPLREGFKNSSYGIFQTNETTLSTYGMEN